MYKTLKIVQIVIWSVIALALVGLLIFAAVGGRLGALRGIHFGYSGATALVKEESADITEDIKRLVIDCESMDVRVVTGDTDQITVSQYSPEDIDESEKFTLEASSSEITIRQKDRDYYFFLHFGLFNENRLEVTIPADYAKDFSIKTVSGDVSLDSDLKLATLTIKQTSGDFTSLRIEAPTVTYSSTSGNVDFGELIAESYECTTVSGDLHADYIKGSGSFKLTSGDVRMGTVEGGEFSVSGVSTDVRVESLTAKGRIKLTSGDVTIGSFTPAGDYDITGTSTDMDIVIAPGASVDIDADTTSGDVDDDYRGTGEEPEYALILNATSGDITIR